MSNSVNFPCVTVCVCVCSQVQTFNPECQPLCSHFCIYFRTKSLQFSREKISRVLSDGAQNEHFWSLWPCLGSSHCLTLLTAKTLRSKDVDNIEPNIKTEVDLSHRSEFKVQPLTYLTLGLFIFWCLILWVSVESEPVLPGSIKRGLHPDRCSSPLKATYKYKQPFTLKVSEWTNPDQRPLVTTGIEPSTFQIHHCKN